MPFLILHISDLIKRTAKLNNVHMGEADRLRVYSSGFRFIKVSWRRVRVVASSARSFLLLHLLVLQRRTYAVAVALAAFLASLSTFSTFFVIISYN
jgi:hypothetical protein